VRQAGAKYGHHRTTGLGGNEILQNRAGSNQNNFQDFACIQKQLEYCGGAMSKNLSKQKAVPRHLERVTNQWQPALTGGTAHERVTDEHAVFKDRKSGGFLAAKDAPQNPA
jgi:hypothetical protein